MNLPMMLYPALVSAMIAVYARYKGPKVLFYMFKPLTTFIIIVIAVGNNLSPNNSHSLYGWLVVAGLLFALPGDIFLMFEEKFIPGLGSFLIAHLLFIAAFASRIGLVFTWWLFLIVTAIALSYGWFMVPLTGKIKIPVALYIAIIGLMIWMGLECYYHGVLKGSAPSGLIGFRAAGSLWAVCGVILFGISDSVLAFNRFRRKFKEAELIILGTYYPAICCLALSI